MDYYSTATKAVSTPPEEYFALTQRIPLFGFNVQTGDALMITQ